MSINVTKVLQDLEGEPIRIFRGMTEDIQLCPACTAKLASARRDLTLRLAITRALTMMSEKTQRLTGQQKFERAELARKVYNDNDVELTAEEISTIKEAVGDTDGPLVVGQVWRLLDPAVAAEKEVTE